ncbi:hypothetical protein, partial [Streptomyces flavofungini]|uniref:hypothetical protein n=1 Tax=Streptomyces flavofungini TaxID=68200 RepID=UPI0034DFA156
MKRSGPLLTLLGGLLLALFMLSLNATTETGGASYGGDAPGATAGTPSRSAGKTPEPSGTSASASGSAKPADAEYAGRTADDSASVAITLEDGKAIAYYCDGRDKESWLKGDVEDDGSMRLTGRRGARLTGDLAGDRISGTVAVAGGHDRFTADKATKSSGLYRATTVVRGAKVDGGWIVLPDGRQVGILNRGGER